MIVRCLLIIAIGEITQVAESAERHWAFRTIVRPEVPVVSEPTWVKNPIDAFLAEQHQQHGLIPQDEAPHIIQQRRLYLDLIGLPPSARDISALKRDLQPGWYERTVDHLLNDPRHGERWARHWMDIWRYSDWWGLGNTLRFSQKHIWHWRDWIIESLNTDMPYDEMIRLMLAADELHPRDSDKLRATGLLARNFFLFNRNSWMDETVEHISKGFLGLTMNCAKCHDHKYDPILQVDFYRMRAFFEPYHVRLDVIPGESDLDRDGIPRVFDALLDAPTYLLIRGQSNNPDKTTAILPGVPEILTFKELEIKSVTLPLDAWQPDRRPGVLDAYLTAARKKIAKTNADLVRVQKQLADATKNKADLPANRKRVENTTNRQAQAATSTTVTIVRAELKVAEAAVDVAAAEFNSVEHTIKAMQLEPTAHRNNADNHLSDLSAPARQQIAAAVQAQRDATVSKARLAVANAELKLLGATGDSQAAAKKTLSQACESLEKALASAQTEIQPTDQYTRLTGAKWTPTRFIYSGNDDPTIEFPAQSTGRRTALADWITDRRNPLTARVAANHIWMRHMGAPLVSTVFDFGNNGSPPTHPELLDWLAAELIKNQWSMKHLHRLIVNSASYRMSSSIASGQANMTKDPDNLFWWRRLPIRLESQVVRDSLLNHAKTLDLTIGGPPVIPIRQADSKRRSLYFFHSHNNRNLFLTTFDEASVNECYQREQSIVPQQALALTNSKLVLDASQQIAKSLSDIANDEVNFIQIAFNVLLGITPGKEEMSASQNAFRSWQPFSDGSTNHVRTQFILSLLNHNDFVTLR